jgi:hypothetical protein
MRISSGLLAHMKPLNRRRRCGAFLSLLMLVSLCGLTIGCHSPSRFIEPIAGICPRGWRVSSSNDAIVLRREVPVWVVGKVSNPARMNEEATESYVKRIGGKIHYELRLRFVPLLSESEFQKLKAAREEAAAKFGTAASGKTEYSQWQVHYLQCQVPRFFTEEQSIFLDRWAVRSDYPGYRIETRFIDVYPPRWNWRWTV